MQPDWLGKHISLKALMTNWPSSIKHGMILINASANENEHV